MSENVDYRLGQLETRLTSIETTLGQVRDKVLSTVYCPAPGKCLDLEKISHDHEKRISDLERYQAKLIGIGIVFVGAASVVGPKISALIFK